MKVGKILFIIIVIILVFAVISYFKQDKNANNANAKVDTTSAVELKIDNTDKPKTEVKEVKTPVSDALKKSNLPSNIKNKINSAVMPREGTASAVHGVDLD